ncbi:MAG: uncharacterized protein QOJ35_20 [Solirubrobacteraceae bacterium]|nr:uncharacterized protein [Solirubrobacteraceae bacterium]
MDPFGSPAAPPAAGWYPDPQGTGSYRYWDGVRWTDALSSAIPPAATASSDTTTWAMAAHLTALAALFVGLPVIGPLIVYLVKKDNPFVHRHAAEALNFNISIMIYGIGLAIVTFAGLFVVVGVLLIPLFFVLAAVWFVLVIVAAVAASRGQEYRYPLTIHFVS